MKFSDEHMQFTAKVIERLNEKAGTDFSSNEEETLKLIKYRRDDGYKEQHFMTVIDKKCSEWLKTSWESFLRPVTLFSKQNFQRYLNERERITTTSKQPAIKSLKSAFDKAKSDSWDLGLDEK